jgi:peptidoglycan glycosyltransferase
MDRQIRKLGAALLVLFLALFVQVNYLQVIAADELANHPGNVKRQLIAEYDVLRGKILANDGKTVLAQSVESTPGDEFRYLRTYPQGALYGHLTGFYSIVSGRSGLERSFNEYLTGSADDLVPQRFIDEIRGRDPRGASVITTLDPALQQIAADALGGRRGAVAAIDPRTGEVLAMVANPSFDPNPLASHDAAKARRAFEKLDVDTFGQKPLISNAAQERFPPGSTFKIVTAAAALENGYGPDSLWDNPLVFDLPESSNTIPNFGGSHCLGGAAKITLAQALQISCNVTFAAVGDTLGAELLVGQAERFGFDQDIPSAVDFAEGTIPEPEYFEDRVADVANSAIGQGSVATNPLHMALIAGAIGNGGTLMVPQFVLEIRDSTGRIVRSFGQEEYGETMSEQSAQTLTTMMVSVVEAGTGTAAQIPGISVAGKTGTAQQGGGRNPHAWFVSFAPAQNPTIAVAVIVMDGGDLGSEATGGAIAAPIAKAVIQASLEGAG